MIDSGTEVIANRPVRPRESQVCGVGEQLAVVAEADVVPVRRDAVERGETQPQRVRHRHDGQQQEADDPGRGEHVERAVPARRSWRSRPSAGRFPPSATRSGGRGPWPQSEYLVDRHPTCSLPRLSWSFMAEFSGPARVSTERWPVHRGRGDLVEEGFEERVRRGVRREGDHREVLQLARPAPSTPASDSPPERASAGAGTSGWGCPSRRRRVPWPVPRRRTTRRSARRRPCSCAFRGIQKPVPAWQGLTRRPPAKQRGRGEPGERCQLLVGVDQTAEPVAGVRHGHPVRLVGGTVPGVGVGLDDARPDPGPAVVDVPGQRLAGLGRGEVDPGEVVTEEAAAGGRRQLASRLGVVTPL